MSNTTKIRQQIKFIIMIPITGITILVLFYAMFSSKDKVEIGPKVKEVNPIISMVDLGYKDVETVESFERNLFLNRDIVGKAYDLTLSIDKVDKIIILDVEKYILNELTLVNDFFKGIVEDKYTDFKKFESGCIGTGCKFPTVKYESAIEKMNLIDHVLWNCEQGYSINELDDGNNIIFLLKENTVIVIRTNNLSLTNGNIETISDVIYK